MVDDGAMPIAGTPDEVHWLRQQLETEVAARGTAQASLAALEDRHNSILLLSRVAIAANEGASLDPLVEEVLALLGQHFGFCAGTLWLRDSWGSGLRPSGTWYRTTPECSTLISIVDANLCVPPASLPSRVAREGRPEGAIGQVSDWLDVDGMGRNLPAVMQVLAVPVFAGSSAAPDPVVGVVGLFSAERIAVDGPMVELIEQVSAQLGVAVQRMTQQATDRPRDIVDRRRGWLRESNGLDPASAAGRLAHDLRTPLNGLLGMLELLLDAARDADARLLAETALESALALHQQVESRIDELGALDEIEA